MNENETACSNCACPLNYDCEKFQLFFNGKYLFVEEYTHNNDLSCDYKKENEQDIAVTKAQKTLF